MTTDSARVTYRGLYGKSPCTLTEMGPVDGQRNPYGTHYMSYDRDPGFGRMAFPVSHGFTITGPAVRCDRCGVYVHLENSWQCPGHGGIAPGVRVVVNDGDGPEACRTGTVLEVNGPWVRVRPDCGCHGTATGALAAWHTLTVV